MSHILWWLWSVTKYATIQDCQRTTTTKLLLGPLQLSARGQQNKAIQNRQRWNFDFFSFNLPHYPSRHGRQIKVHQCGFNFDVTSIPDVFSDSRGGLLFLRELRQGKCHLKHERWWPQNGGRVRHFAAFGVGATHHHQSSVSVFRGDPTYTKRSKQFLTFT